MIAGYINMKMIRILYDVLFLKKSISLMITKNNYWYLKYIPTEYIEELSFFYYNNILDEEVKIYKNLKKLDISYCHDLTNESIRDMDKLEYLNITYNRNITNAVFVNKSKLKILRISQTNITSEILVNCKNLEYLDISYSDFIIREEQYEYLKGLKKLNIRNTKNEVKDIMDNIGDIEIII
jgi:Leucine-rich repeat (LRR) protein